MADEPQQGQIVEATIGLGKTGATIEAPYSQLGPGGEEWSKLDHLIVADGLYEAAWSQVAAQSLTIENNDGGTGLSNAQKVKWIFREPDTSLSTSDLKADIVVTTREIYVKQSDGTMVNMTPIYEEGTASCAGATTAVVGTGTAWTTHAIQPGMLMRFPSVSATWIPISAVGGNTAITLESNGPNTGGSIAYEIRRCFGGNAKFSTTANEIRKNRIFAAVRNGSLYVAGNTVDGAEIAVIEVPDILENSALDPANSRYVLTRAARFTGQSANSYITSLWQVVGMHLADDGRIVLATWEGAANFRIKNRVRWSSPTSVDEWRLVDGSGFSDIPGPGSIITAVGEVGGNPSFHFVAGITMGVPTGQLDVPYDFRGTQAECGASCPEVLSPFYGGDLFVGNDFDLYLFNGSTATPVGGPTFQFEAYSLGDEDGTFDYSAAMGTWACGYEGVTNSFHLFCNWTDSSADMGCHHVQLQIPTESNPRRLYTFDWQVPITCLSDPTFSGRGFAIGFPSAFQESGGLASSTVVSFRSLPTRPLNATNLASVPALKTGQPEYFLPRARTNWIDFGVPGWRKNLRAVEAWLMPPYSGPSSPPAQFSITIESLPIEINNGTGNSTNYPSPYTFTASQHPTPPSGGTALPSVVVTRTFAHVDPLAANPPDEFQSNQVPSGDSFRISVLSSESGSETIHGLIKVRVEAELAGPLNALGFTEAL